MCKLFHKWGKWEDITIKVTVFSDTAPADREIEGQRKYCTRCNKKKRRKV